MVHKRFRKWLAALVSVLLLVTAIPASAAQAAMSRDEAVALLQGYGLVKGDQNGDLRLDDNITRAEAATIFVRALGYESFADSMKDTVPFTDTKGHWAAGYVSLANRKGLMKGRTDTIFDPNANITNAEVLTVLLRLVEREPSGPWSPAAIIQAADQLGLMPEGPANAPAYRGGLFRSMAIALSSLPLSDGQTALQKYVDNVPPVVTLGTLPASVTTDTVTVSGTVTDAKSLTINGQDVSIAGNRFSTSVALNVGANTITVVAKDAAGNTATQTAQVSRGGQVASITVTGPNQVETGKAITLTVTAKDASGNTLPSSLVTGTSSTGTYNTATSTFTAGATPGTATITFTAGSVTKAYQVSVLGAAADATALSIKHTGTTLALTSGKIQTVQVQVLDKDGAALSYDQGRSVQLTGTGAGITITPAIATTVAGIATFTVYNANEGEVDLTATSGTLTPDSVSAEFVTSTRIVLTATPSTAIADGSTPIAIRASLQDENGDPVINNTSNDILVSIDTNSDATDVTMSSLIIRRGTSSSAGNDGEIVPGTIAETVKVSGTINSNHSYSVVPATVTFRLPAAGSAAKFEIAGSYATYNPANLSGPLTLTVRATDSQGNVITSGSYAFQIQVRTSNDEDLVGGVPDGLSLMLGTSGATPVVGADGAIVARTTSGTSTLKLEYNKSGKVYLKVVGVAAATDAISDDGTPDSATSAKNFDSTERTVTFAAPADHLKVTVDLPNAKLTNQDVGVLPANGSAIAKVNVYLVDAEGGWIPNIYNGRATLAKVAGTGTGTRLTGTTDSTAVFDGGVATFTVAANRTADVDEWEASATNLPLLDPKPTVTIITTDAKLDQPEIVGIAGDSGYPNRVTVEDTYMEINFRSVTGAYPADTYGYVKVWRGSTSTLVYTSDVMDLSASPYVRVPKSAMINAADVYTITVNNGYNDSTRSLAWPQDGTKVVREEEVKVDITSVQYDAVGSKLYVRFSGASGGEVHPENMSIKNTALNADYPLGSATCTVSSTSFTCTNVVLDPAEFQGTALLVTEDGWYTKDTTGQAAPAEDELGNNLVSPMGYINYAVVSFGQDTATPPHVTATLTLYGKNLNQGKIYLDHLKFNDDNTLKMSPTTTYVTATSPTTVVITIPGYNKTVDVASALHNTTGPNITLDASAGWLVNSSYNTGALANIPVYVKLDVTRVQYDASTNELVFTSNVGGFEGGTVDPAGLVIKDRNGATVLQLTSADTAEITSDHEIRITLTDPHADVLEYDSAVPGDRNWDNLVWISSVNDGTHHWFQNGDDWNANELPHLIYKLNW